MAAAAALVLQLLVIVLVALVVVEQFPQGLIVLGGVALALGTAWFALRRRTPRYAGL